MFWATGKIIWNCYERPLNLTMRFWPQMRFGLNYETFYANWPLPKSRVSGGEKIPSGEGLEHPSANQRLETTSGNTGETGPVLHVMSRHGPRLESSRWNIVDIAHEFRLRKLGRWSTQWLLVGAWANPSEKYEFVKWDDDIANIWELMGK